MKQLLLLWEGKYKPGRSTLTRQEYASEDAVKEAEETDDADLSPSEDDDQENQMSEERYQSAQNQFFSDEDNHDDQEADRDLDGDTEGSERSHRKASDDPDEAAYVISAADWKQTDQEVAGSTKLTPARMAPSLSKVTNRGYWNADSYAYFLMHLGPIDMRDRLSSAFYEHFVDLSRLVKQTTQTEFGQGEVDSLEAGYKAWVKKFEE
ncbi:hypothetical protein QFC24_004046 [Naganishia onofrii]|uniref:Uncharacterized protein n=1 Tax=Naganishia onofrii TaxID=1851511 RepID=A0ACC2XGE2_9TREE|nr:hypothetical protein QFC24_004046 [Naganishia onofrii]